MSGGLCGEAETGHRVRCFWLEALEVSSRWLYILSLRLTLIFLFPLLLVVPSIRAPWWGSLSQVGVSVPVAPGGQPQGPGLWDPITPDSHSCKSPMWSLSQAGIHWQDPSPATRWCLGSGACPELLSFPGRGPHPGQGPEGRTKALVTAQEPVGLQDYLLQLPRRTEEGTGAQRGEGSSRSLQGGGESSVRAGDSVEQGWVCARVCAVCGEAEGVATTEGSGLGRGGPMPRRETLLLVLLSLSRVYHCKSYGLGTPRSWANRGGWAPLGHSRQGSRTMLPGISATPPIPRDFMKAPPQFHLALWGS